MVLDDYRKEGNRGRPELKALCEAFDVTTTRDDNGRVVACSGGWKAIAVTTDVIWKFEADRLRVAKRATVNKDLAALRRGFKLAIEAGRLATMPKIKTPEPKNARQGFFERDQLESLLPHLPDYLRPVARFAYLTGWRVPSEVLTLRWKQVDFTAGVVRLEPNTTKNGEGREFPFGVLPELKAVLEEQRARTAALAELTGERIEWVFHRQGSRISRNVLSWECRKACEKAGLEGRIPHDFRRTAVRNLVRAGVWQKVAMALTGHKTPTVFERYNITDQSDRRDAVAKLAAFLTVGHNSGTSAGEDES